MYKGLLSVIAVCLIMITAKLYIPEAQAEVAGMDQFELKMDLDFKRAVYSLVERCAVSGYVGEGASYIDLSIDC